MSYIKLKRITIVAFCLAIAVATGAVTAAPAFAVEENPGWEACEEITGGKFDDSACEKTGGAGGWGTIGFRSRAETRGMLIEAKRTEKFTAEALGLTIECKGVKAGPGSKVFGSVPETSGTAELTLEYEECEVAGHKECEINGEKSGKAKIKTETLIAELVFLTKAAAEGQNANATGTLLKPKTGKKFMIVELKGEHAGGCPTGTEKKLKSQVKHSAKTSKEASTEKSTNSSSPQLHSKHTSSIQKQKKSK